MRTKIRIYLMILAGVFCLMAGCGEDKTQGNTGGGAIQGMPIESTVPDYHLEEKPSENMNGLEGDPLEKALVCESGMTLETRILTPDGYERNIAAEGSLTSFLRQFPMKESGAKVHYYDGTEKWNQQDYVAVFDLPIENYDLQQCADSVMRMYAEYYWSIGQYDRIAFHFTNGFLAEYSRWREGERIQVSGNDVKWVASKSYDDSYECFVQYLKMVFCYAGTLSMDRESSSTTLEELKAGDVFLYGGSPGHVVLVVDVCENTEGQKAFLLGQGYMPAQEFHLLKNPQHEEDPWYYEEEVQYPFVTPEYVFQEGSLKKVSY